MAKKSLPRTFNDVLALLGGQRFDVAPARDGAKRAPNAVQVGKYGVAAEIAPAPDGSVEILARPGWLLNGEIARLLIAHRIKRVPVVRDGRIVGIVSRADLVQALATEEPQLTLEGGGTLGEAEATSNYRPSLRGHLTPR